MEIPPASWRKPLFLGDPDKWEQTGVTKGENYFYMGRWRMTFAFDFVRSMGYPYILHMDDDLFILNPVKYNIVENFKNANFVFGSWKHIEGEIRQVLMGLPEFVRYYMVTRNYLQPIGSLFEHFKEGNIKSLSMDKWDKQYVRGCFNVWSIDFLYEEIVQDFLALVWRTGSDVEQRWQEQAVMNMIRLLFVPNKNWFQFEDVEFEHSQKCPSTPGA
jgi:hypothetical protein